MWFNEDLKCPVCESSRFKKAFSTCDRFFSGVQFYDYFECSECKGLVLCPKTLEGVAWSATIAYPDNYPIYGQTTTLHWYHSLFHSYFFPPIPSTPLDKACEIGAGTGLLAEYLKHRVTNLKALEISMDAVKIAQELGRPVEQGDWESYRPDDSSLDLLIMNQVIEHLTPPPRDVFRKAYRMLKPGGFWSIRTPNAASWGRRTFGSCWHPLETPRHTVIYSQVGLHALAIREGFSIERFRYTGRAYDVEQSLRYASTDGIRLPSIFAFLKPSSLVTRGLAMLMNCLGQGDNMEYLLRKNESTGANA